MALAISTVLVTSLTACGDGNGGEAEEVVTPVEAQPMLSELELEILNLETKYNKGEFTGADYLALADAYSRAGDIRKQRDMLEQDYRLYEDAGAFSTLQGLSVNLEEETEEIRSRAQEMLNDLELSEYLDESVNLIDSGDWFSTMMPKLKEGQRSYYLERDAQPLFYAQVGYTGEGQRFSKVWYTGSETKRFLSQEGTIIRLVTVTSTVAGAEDPASTAGTDTTAETADIQDTATPRAATPADMGAWNGTFESWSVDCATGSITREELKIFLILLNPFAPHLTEEMWVQNGYEGMLNAAKWPEFDEAKCAVSEIEIVVQVNGKIRARMNVDANTVADDAIALAKTDKKVAAEISNSTIVKELYIPGKLVNIVIKPAKA